MINIRCVIVGGAVIGDCDRIKNELRSDDYFIYCDSGLSHIQELGIDPDLIIGDFDSHENPHLNVETIVLPCEKDDTDTVFAVKEALKRGYDDFLLVGVTGRRLDHTIANLSILIMLDKTGAKGRIIDDFEEISIVSKNAEYVDDTYPYFSLVSISGTAKGVTVKNAKYTLEDAIITCDYQYGVSNEPLAGKVSEISVKEGSLLLIKVFKG